MEASFNGGADYSRTLCQLSYREYQLLSKKSKLTTQTRTRNRSETNNCFTTDTQMWRINRYRESNPGFKRERLACYLLHHSDLKEKNPRLELNQLPNIEKCCALCTPQIEVNILFALPNELRGCKWTTGIEPVTSRVTAERSTDWSYVHKKTGC